MFILAVENSDEDLRTLKSQIRAAFPEDECKGFVDPLMAIKVFDERKPDFTIFSKDMWLIDGFTFARTLRRRYSDFTGVMISNDEGSRQDAVRFSLDYLVKPLDASELRRIWERMKEGVV